MRSILLSAAMTALMLTAQASSAAQPTDQQSGQGMALPDKATVPSKESPDDNQLTQFVAQLKTFSADFVQTQRNTRGKVEQKSSGHFVLARPGRFYWVYEKPYVQKLISRGGILWVYDPDLSQVTRSKLSNNKGAPIGILLGTRPLTDVFVITPLGRDDDGMDWFHLKPKGKPGDFSQVLIGLDHKGIKVMEFVDALNNTTRVLFSHRRMNQSVDTSLFDFQPPAGVDVVEGR